MAYLEKPSRMCIVCRSRNAQDKMLRLQCNGNKKLVSYTHYGRSFYICNTCIEYAFEENKNRKKLEQTLCRVCKNKDDYIFQLKEILTHVR
ncbi:DUF448 domain-containing protein [Candidatus Marinarcus aquaticus]|uniref:YlxR domain-containing protein n=1 Tax=Candidatus Marinarcus aquaticus TaxID=2044504 RepID=A0A4Q0XU45_9BACT|nr:DUF448 domain-containing protein [Candidatus Marinarcus aquaticus]RXJ57713.1 hypothetical protein CRV04_07840 [Candidatus Marinarcus aquaticus]